MADPFLIYIFETFSMNQWDKDRIFFHKENHYFRFLILTILQLIDYKHIENAKFFFVSHFIADIYKSEISLLNKKTEWIQI